MTLKEILVLINPIALGQSRQKPVSKSTLHSTFHHISNTWRNLKNSSSVDVLVLNLH